MTVLEQGSRYVRFNPFSEIRFGGFNEVSDSKAVAQYVVDSQITKKADQWDRDAVTLIFAAILHVRYCRRDKTMAGLIQFLTEANNGIFKLLRTMQSAKHDTKDVFNWVDPLTLRKTRNHPIIASVAREFMKRNEDDLTVIVNVALIYLKAYPEDRPCNIVFKDFRHN